GVGLAVLVIRCDDEHGLGVEDGSCAKILSHSIRSLCALARFPSQSCFELAFCLSCLPLSKRLSAKPRSPCLARNSSEEVTFFRSLSLLWDPFSVSSLLYPRRRRLKRGQR